ncbi:DUF6508 domain-containing protein [Rhodococcus sp. 2H158]
MVTVRDDAPFRAVLDAMTPRDWEELRELLQRIDDNGAPFAPRPESSTVSDAADAFAYPMGGPIVDEAMTFLYDREFIVPFDWPAWDGKTAVEQGDLEAIGSGTAEDCLRYLTVISRADRFMTGFIVSAFDRRLVQTALHRLLEIMGSDR